MCLDGCALLLTDGNSKSFWLMRLRMYSIRYLFSGHANCTGGVRVLIAVTMVCHKHTNPTKINWNLDDTNTQDGKQFWHIVYKQKKKPKYTTYLNSLLNIILDVLNFLLLLSEIGRLERIRYNDKNKCINNIYT